MKTRTVTIITCEGCGYSPDHIEAGRPVPTEMPEHVPNGYSLAVGRMTEAQCVEFIRKEKSEQARAEQLREDRRAKAVQLCAADQKFRALCGVFPGAVADPECGEGVAELGDRMESIIGANGLSYCELTYDTGYGHRSLLADCIRAAVAPADAKEGAKP